MGVVVDGISRRPWSLFKNASIFLPLDIGVSLVCREMSGGEKRRLVRKKVASGG
jgi:hypothetical protein